MLRVYYRFFLCVTSLFLFRTRSVILFYTSFRFGGKFADDLNQSVAVKVRREFCAT